MSDKERPCVAITGASRGIGRAAMQAFGRAGFEVMGIARSGAALESVCDELAAEGIRASHAVCDLADPAAVEALAAELGRRPRFEGLVLNAGVASHRALLDSCAEERMRELMVNYLAPAQLVTKLAPVLEDRSGFIVAVGSLAGLVPFPTNANYAASKAALGHLLRSLRLELSAALHLGLVLPGHTRTEMASGYRAPGLLSSSPEQVAEALVRCARLRQQVVIPGLPNQLLAAANWLAPRLLDEAFRVGVRLGLTEPARAPTAVRGEPRGGRAR